MKKHLNLDRSLLNENLDKILDLINDGIYISDNNGKTLKINKSYEIMTGLKEKNILGKNVMHLVDKGIFDTVVNPIVVNSGETKTIVQIDSKEKRSVLTGYPIFDDKGKVVLVVSFLRDFSLMNELKEQVKSQQRILDKYKSNVQHIIRENDKKYPLIVHSEIMQEIIQSIEAVAVSEASVLLEGETGVGKDVISKKIHQASKRSEMPFVKVDCPTIPENLLESELFGYASGAFSGAHAKGKLGFFEMAEKGTLFLDEIGELPISMQSKLLRVLEDRELVRLGSAELRKIDVRVIAATNRDLEEEVHQGRFRRDLYYRLRVAVFNIPPMRDRQKDIVPMANYFLEKYAKRYQKEINFSSETLDIFCAYSWPGNVREMENLVQSLVITNTNGCIMVSDLPRNMTKPADISHPELSNIDSECKYSYENGIFSFDLPNEIESGKRTLKNIINDIERDILKYAKKKLGSNEEIASRFEINRSTLFRKLKT